MATGAGSSAWAWLGDMELDDTLLGLGAAGIFASSTPLAVGFLVNAAHCAEKGKDGSLKATAMYHEKRAFLDAFFGGRFFPILDRWHSAGKGRGSTGELTAEDLGTLGKACGLEDELAAWISCVLSKPPEVLHLVLSGPLLGRGEEVCAALAQLLSSPVSAAGGTVERSPRIVLWSYAGSFNLAHSSDADKASLKRLLQDNAPNVSSVETTLKSGAWLCEPPQPFWGSLCPTAWSLEQARTNAVGFDISTDIQSVNMFLEEYSSQPSMGPRRGVKWIFEQIAETASKTQQGTSAVDLLQELEVRSLETNLTKMVQPSSSSMGKVREALSKEAQESLEVAYKNAATLVEEVRSSFSPDGLRKATAAAQEYAALYSGADGRFLETGCTECFPKDKPYSGPRLDKRCIIRCMAQGKLQGGPTADVLIILALLLHLERLDEEGVEPKIGSGAARAEGSGWCGMCSAPPAAQAARGPNGPNPCRRVPSSTRDLLQLEQSKTLAQAFVVVLAAADLGMGEEAKNLLAPLVDEVIDSIVRGAKLLQKAGQSGAWGTSHPAAPKL